MELLFPVLLLAVMYFLLIRPQQQRVKKQREVVSSVALGDEVVTVGGLVGVVVRLDEESAELETTPGTVVRYRRSAIAGKLLPDTDTTAIDTTDDASDGVADADGGVADADGSDENR